MVRFLSSWFPVLTVYCGSGEPPLCAGECPGWCEGAGGGQEGGPSQPGQHTGGGQGETCQVYEKLNIKVPP